MAFNQRSRGFINTANTQRSGQRSGSSKKKRIMLAGLTAVVLIFIFGLVFSLLFSGNNKAAEQTLKLAQQHRELQRIAEIGSNKARSSGAKNLSVTLKLTLQSYENRVTAIAKKDQKLSSVQLSGGKNAKVDKALVEAEQNNRFDEAIIETLHEQLGDYLSQVKKVRDASGSKQDRQTLTDLHDQLSKLLPG